MQEKSLEENNLELFCKTHHRVFIYGAGRCGLSCKDFVTSESFSGFITTSGKEEIEGVPVYKYQKIKENLTKDDGIILALRQDLQREVLSENDFECDLIRIDEYDILKKKLEKNSIIKDQERVNNSYHIGIPISKIAVIHIAVTYGDVIWNSALLRELRGNFQNAEIDLVVNAKHAEIFEYCPYINRVFKYEKVRRNRSLSQSMLDDVSEFFEKNLSGRTYDAIFLVRHIPHDEVDLWENIVLMNLVDVKYRFGHVYLEDGINEKIIKLIRPFFSDLLIEKSPEHVARQYLRLIECVNGKINKISTEMWLSQKEYSFADRIIKDYQGKLIVLGPIGSTKNRAWSTEKYINLINRITEVEESIHFIVLGGNDAADIGKEIKQECCGKVADLTGKTSLLEAAALISRSSLYVGVDTGLMQMASACGIPIVEISNVIQGTPKSYPGAMEWTGPYCVNFRVLQPKKGLDGCKYHCKIDYHCINQIGVDEVFNAVRDLLGELEDD